jgi:hypothetical protein
LGRNVTLRKAQGGSGKEKGRNGKKDFSDKKKNY